MTKFTKTLFLFLTFAFSTNLLLAQLSVTGQVSGLKFMGDVGKKVTPIISATCVWVMA